VVNALRSKGIDIVSIKELTAGVRDETVLKTANKQNRILITFDSDFGELVFRQKLKARGVILLKFAPKSTQQVVDTILNVLKTQAKIENHFLIFLRKEDTSTSPKMIDHVLVSLLSKHFEG